MKRVLVPLLAAVAVLGLVIAVFWVTGAGDDGSDQASFGSGDTPADSDSPTGGGVPGDVGSAEPVEPSVEPQPDDGSASPSGPLAVPVDSYFRYGGRRLALSYYIGVPECYGTIDEPVVEERPDAVIVTLTRVPPETDEDVACIEIAMHEFVDITLSEPLGDRAVLDGSFDPPSKVREANQPPEQQH